MRRLLFLLLCTTLFLFMVGCDFSLLEIESSVDRGEVLPDMDGNPYTTHRKYSNGEIKVECDYTEVYIKLQLSKKYTSWGSFGEDGVMLVKKSDYTGDSYGYIDYNGNEVVPLTSNLVGGTDFHHGYAIVYYECDYMGNGLRGVIDKTGKVVAKYENYAPTDACFLESGIVLGRVDTVYPYKSGGYFFLCSKNNDLIRLGDYVDIDNTSYSEGWTKVYIEYNNNTVPAAKFYDENGEEVLSIDENSNEYYGSIVYVDDFEEEVSYVTFVGAKGRYYRVKINRSGEWLEEPVQIDDIYYRFH